jgi:hypothetical protein
MVKGNGAVSDLECIIDHDSAKNIIFEEIMEDYQNRRKSSFTEILLQTRHLTIKNTVRSFLSIHITNWAFLSPACKKKPQSNILTILDNLS